MKTIFLKPIGTLAKLGTAREWTADVIGLIVCVVAVILALIFL